MAVDETPIAAVNLHKGVGYLYKLAPRPSDSHIIPSFARYEGHHSAAAWFHRCPKGPAVRRVQHTLQLYVNNKPQARDGSDWMR